MSGSSSGSRAAPAHSALLSHPYFTIDGISPSAPVLSQIEQVEQLNTLLLGDIDANFSRFHHIITSKVLPEFKRFALSGGPTKEAADFWRHFFEVAAGVSHHLGADGGDETAVSSSPPQTEYDEHTLTLRRGDDETTLLGDRTMGSSFLFDPTQGATSTPLPARTGIPNNSWEESMESPFDRVDRQLGTLRLDESTSDMSVPSLPSGYHTERTAPHRSYSFDSSDVSTGTAPTPEFGRAGRETDESADYSTGGDATPRADRTAHRAPSPSYYVSPARPTRLIDLSNTPLNARVKPKAGGMFAFDDYDDDDLKFSMSPPVTMNFGKLPATVPPRAEAILNAGSTPMKAALPAGYGASFSSASSGGLSFLGPPPGTSSAAAQPLAHAKDGDNLLTGFSQDDYEPSPRMPTPEGLGRYSMLPSDFGAARRLFTDGEDSPAPAPPALSALPAASSRSGSSSSNPLGARAAARPSAVRRPSRRSIANTSYGSDIQTTEDGPGRIITDDDESFDDDDDTFSFTGGQVIDEYDAAARQGFQIVDDSYLSDDGDTQYAGLRYPLAAHGVGGPAPAPADADGFTDSGAPAGATNDASAIFGRPSGIGGQLFQLHQQDDMVTYHGGRLEDARLPGSPTRQAAPPPRR